MAEDLNELEPTAEEKAKFEADVLKAAEDAMKMDGSASSPTENKVDAERHPEEQSDEGSSPDAAAEQPADAASEQPAQPAAALGTP